MDLATLHEFEDEIRKTIPGFRVAFKDESKLQALTGFFVRPFNPTYDTRYVTTLGTTVWFSSRKVYEDSPSKSFSLLAHEFVHLVDGRAQPVWFRLSYLFPQLLGPLVLVPYGILAGRNAWLLLLPLLGYILGCFAALWSTGAFWAVLVSALVGSSVLAVLKTGWLAAIFFLALACFAPLPSPGRVKAEMRGYTMSLAVLTWAFGPKTAVWFANSMVKEFVGPPYYFMSWDGKDVLKRLIDGLGRVVSGDILKDSPFDVVHSFLDARGLVKKP